MIYANAEHTIITDGNGRFIPCVDGNRDYAEIVTSGAIIAPWVRWHALEDAQAELTQLVKAECQARILARYSVFDQLNGNADTVWIAAMREYSNTKEAEIAALDMAGCEAYDIKAGWPDTGGLHGPESMIYEEQADDTDSDIPGDDSGDWVEPDVDLEIADPDSADWGSLDTSDSGGGLAPFEVVEGEPQMEVATGGIPAPEIDSLSMDHPDNADTPQMGGILIQGDVLRTAQMEKAWAVDEAEAGLVDRYDLAGNEQRLSVLRGQLAGAKEGSLPPLTDAEQGELAGLETFASWLLLVRAHAAAMRKAIRTALDADALAMIDTAVGWPQPS